MSSGTEVLAYRVAEDLRLLLSRGRDAALTADVVMRAQGQQPAFRDCLTAEQVRVGVLRQDARVEQLVDIWRGAFDFDIRIESASAQSLLVFVRSEQDWLRFVDLCVSCVLLNHETGEGVVAGRFAAT